MLSLLIAPAYLYTSPTTDCIRLYHYITAPLVIYIRTFLVLFYCIHH